MVPSKNRKIKEKEKYVLFQARHIFQVRHMNQKWSSGGRSFTVTVTGA
jgi:hypothetical protein